MNKQTWELFFKTKLGEKRDAIEDDCTSIGDWVYDFALFEALAEIMIELADVVQPSIKKQTTRTDSVA